MNAIMSLFSKLQKEGKKAFIPYVMAGYPDMETSIKLIEALSEKGADMIEVGIPFSDPLADGPVIQEASRISLKNGFTLTDLLNNLREVNKKITAPLVIMIYYNMLFQRGEDKFLNELRQSGCSGLIIPDLPPEGGENIKKLAENNEISLSFLVAPNSSNERILLADRASTGFLYAVSLKGITGARKNLPEGLREYIERIKSVSSKPLVVGFGISTAEQAGTVSSIADGVIVASALVKTLGDGDIDKFTCLTEELRRAVIQGVSGTVLQPITAR